MKKLLSLMFRSFLLGALYASPTWVFSQSLNIYCEDDKPMQFKAADGSLTGMTVELVREIQKLVGNSDPIQLVPWARGLKNLDEEPNTILFSMGRTAERNGLYQWIGPIAESVFGLYVKADSPLKIHSLDDAKQVHSIGVYRDDVRDQFLTKAGFQNLERANDNVQNFKKLMSGRVDMYATSSNDVASNAENAGYKTSDVKLALAFLKAQIFIAASKNTDPAVVAKWNAALAALKKNGTFKTIFLKYYPDRNLPGPEITKF